MPPRETRSAAEWVPPKPTLVSLRAAVQECQGCDLYRNAIQAVLGAGPVQARAMLVGEQPGDQEDKQGAPFVGPAGRLLDEALADAGIDRGDVYVTNAVKHFKNEPRGKRRIHKKPSTTEVKACRPWLDAEIDVVQPDLIVCLGATASQALLGPKFKLTEQRGVLIPQGGRQFMATIHPSALLRLIEREERQAAFAQLVEDLKVAARALSR